MFIVRIVGFFLFLAAIVSCLAPFAAEEEVSTSATVLSIAFGIVLMFASTLLIGMTQHDSDTREMAKRVREMEEESDRRFERTVRRTTRDEERKLGSGDFSIKLEQERILEEIRRKGQKAREEWERNMQELREQRERERNR